MQLRHCEVMQYVEYLKVDIQRVIKDHATIKEWAYILHDKDDTAAHWHIYLNFGKSSCDTALVAKWFEVEEQYVSKVKGRKSDMLLYLIHGNDTQRDKYQYSPDEVVSNFDYSNTIKTERILGDFEHYSYAQMLKVIDSLPKGEKAKAFSTLEKLWKIQCQILTLNPERKIEVVFICGKAGCGKTYYAKKMLDQLGYDYCVSSSSNDPFQDYCGQKAIILDDLRDKAFELEDLLKMLDNNTASSVRSRFSNKVFNGKMIVITTSVPLSFWYWYYKGNINDNLEQLYRRISCYVDMTRETISIYTKIGLDGRPTGAVTKYQNDVPRLVHTEERETVVLGAFDAICAREPIRVSYFQEKLNELEMRKNDT